MTDAHEIPSSIDENAPGVVNGEIIDEDAYYAYRCPRMADHWISFCYWDFRDVGNAKLVALFEAEAIKRGVDLSPIPASAVWRNGGWQDLSKRA